MITIAGLLVLLVIVAAAQIIEAVAGLVGFAAAFFATVFVVIPFKITQFVFRRRYIPATQRNLTRASSGIFVFLLLVSGARWLPHDPAAEAMALGLGAVSLLYLCIGYVNSRGAARDPMAVVWWSAGALICAAVLIFAPGATPADPRVLESLAYAGIAACVLRVWLLLRPVPGATLPHPSKIPGMPMAGPASLRAAHAALGRRGRGARPKFKV